MQASLCSRLHEHICLSSLYVFVSLLFFLLLMAFDSAYTLYRILLMSLWEHTKILLTVRWDIYLRLMRGGARWGEACAYERNGAKG